MARVQNLGNRKRGVSLSMQRLQNQKTEAFRAYVWAMFIRILENTPQFSGMAVANWNVSIGAPDFSYDPSLGANIDWKTVRDSAPYKKGDRFWIDHAIRRNQAVLDSIKPGDKVFIPGIREAILAGKEEIDAQVIARDGVKPIHLFFQNLTADERQILADGCLMNYYKNKK